MRLFLDANVVFSAAHNPRGNARELFGLASQGHCELVTSAYALEEARRNIALKYPECVPVIAELASALHLVAEAKEGAGADEHGLPGKDAPILSAAIAARVALLVTGDQRHFGPLFSKVVGGVEVVKPAEALSRLLDAIAG